MDDLRIPGALHVTFVRSAVAHARLRCVDVARVADAPGVVAAFAAADLPEAARILSDCHAHPTLPSRGVPTLARDRVRYVGEPIVAVVAESRYLAEDAAELVQVCWTAWPSASRSIPPRCAGAT